MYCICSICVQDLRETNRNRNGCFQHFPGRVRLTMYLECGSTLHYTILSSSQAHRWHMKVISRALACPPLWLLQ